VDAADAAVHFEHGEVIQCDFKPGSVGRSIDLDKRAGSYFNSLPTNKNWLKSKSLLLNAATIENRESS
jgi:hypothetical protein